MFSIPFMAPTSFLTWLPYPSSRCSRHCGCGPRCCARCTGSTRRWRGARCTRCTQGGRATHPTTTSHSLLHLQQALPSFGVGWYVGSIGNLLSVFCPLTNCNVLIFRYHFQLTSHFGEGCSICKIWDNGYLISDIWKNPPLDVNNNFPQQPPWHL